MATAPQFVTTPNGGTPGTLTAANTATDGTGATGRLLVFTAGADGSILPLIRAMHAGTNVATLIRAFVNNGADPEVGANNVLVAEIAISANTLSQTAESIPYDIDFRALFGQEGLILAGGYRVYVTLATAVAAGIRLAPLQGGDF